MKNFALSLLAFQLLVLVAGQSLMAQEKYTLKSGYPPGQYEKVSLVIMDMTSEASEMKIPVKMTQTRYITIDAAEKNADGTQKIVAEITREVMKTITTMQGLEMEMEYDSAAPDADKSPMRSSGVLVGLKVTTLYDKDGNPIKSEGWDEFFKKLMADPYFKNMAESSKAQVTDELGQITAESMDNPLLCVTRVIMPTAPVAVGETWKTEGTFGTPMQGGKFKTNVENTLKEIKTENGRKIAVIALKMTSRPEEPKKMIGAGSEQTMNFTKMDIRADSIASVDIESGLLLKSTSDTEMETEMEMDAASKIKSSGKVKTTVTITPKKR